MHIYTPVSGSPFVFETCVSAQTYLHLNHQNQDIPVFYAVSTLNINIVSERSASDPLNA